ncbi:hypothetical protein P3T36_006486 [Kitasatospora sp. MAP12-15]|nr:hypothetical protein [Kitasatospora sp. MAP12-44]
MDRMNRSERHHDRPPHPRALGVVAVLAAARFSR